MTYAMTYRQAVYHGACEIVDTIGEILGGWDAYDVCGRRWRSDYLEVE